MFSFLFGKRSKQVAGAVPVEPIATTLQQRATDLEKKVRQLEAVCASHHEAAIEQKKAGRTQSALYFLKKEAMAKESLAATHGLLLTVAQQLHAVEQAQQTVETLAAVHAAATSVRDAQTSWSADRVAELTDSMDDAVQTSREIQDLLARQTCSSADADLLESLNRELELHPLQTLPTPPTSSIRLAPIKPTPQHAELEMLETTPSSSLNLFRVPVSE